MKNKIRAICLCCLLFFSFKAAAQSCSGSPGAPVVNIDFGSGTVNPGPTLSSAVPGATTNYNFASYAAGNPPVAPNDGDYALLNAVPVNSAWHTGATDHTGNANGYMAFFNAAPTPGEFYRQTVSNLCAGTTYEFAAWTANVINADLLPTAILPNITFNILDPGTQTVLSTFNTGDIPHFSRMTWKQYSFLFTLPAGNTSVTLVLANNNIGGSAQPGNDLAIDDITFRPCGPLTKASLSNSAQLDSTGITGCIPVNLFGQINGSFNSPSYQWQISNDDGINYTDINGANSLNAVVSNLISGKYIIRLVSAEAGNISSNNCRFISNTVKLSVTNCAAAGISGIINKYTPVTDIDPCTNKLTVTDASAFNNGDTVLLIQMKGAAITTVPDNTFGSITAENNAGGYEFNYVKSKTGNTIELKNVLLQTFDAANGKVQLVRVPYFQTVTITDTLTCLPWNGSMGGVLVLNSATDVMLNAPIDVSNKGFRGGSIGAGFACGSSDWAVPAGIGGSKGEGIADYIPGNEAGGARLANGGGGSFSANTGAGGGANFGDGGFGGREYNGCNAGQQSIGGQALTYSGNIVFAGGGGGGAEQDNGQPIVPGGNGGGIIIIKAATLNSNDQLITSNGENINTVISDEGGAGGGAGGSVLFFINNFTGNVSVEANGGRGSDNNNQIYPGKCHGPGGGGGGGYVGFSSAGIPAAVSVVYSGGAAGKLLNPASACFNTTGGAGDGAAGGSRFSLLLPAGTEIFKKNIDSVRIQDSVTGCRDFNFKGLAFINSAPIRSWQWIFDDGATSPGQEVMHSFSNAGQHTVKLLAADDNGCRDSIMIIVNSGGINFDFTFEQNVCNPRSVKFTAAGDSTSDIYWSLGDGTIINNDRNPLHVFADTGYYVIQYSTGNGICTDTLKKIIGINYRDANIILTPDTTICFNSSKLLRSNIDSSLSFCWKPGNFLNNINFPNPTTSTPSTIIYNLISAAAENNLVINGDFSNGDAAFTSGYIFNNSSPLNNGDYTVTSSSLNAGLATGCNDHTGSTGNMLIAKDNTFADKTIWQQNVSVQANTNYIFSVWMQAAIPLNPSDFKLSINDNIVLDSIIISPVACTWKKYFVVWNSGSRSTAKLNIISHSSPAVAEYFVLDDISFARYFIQKDSIKITIDTPFIQTTNDTAICQSLSLQLNTTGAAAYSWLPATGLSNAAIANPAATPDTTVKYIVTGSDAFGCKAKDSLTVTVKAKPITAITGNGDTLVCRNTAVSLFAAGGIGYRWSPAITLSDSGISTPVASPPASTRYYVTVTGANGCSSTDSVNVTLKPFPNFTVSPDQSACINAPAQLLAAGGNFYLWSPASLVSNPDISNPFTLTTLTTVYTVIIKDTSCGDADTLTTTFTVLPLPTVKAAKSNDVNCSAGTAILSASGALQYVWAPAASLDHAMSPSPIAAPGRSTQYTVKGTDANGCSNSAAITVLADFTGKATYLMPSAFSPNGDGHNDCYRLKYFGQVQQLEFTIYNRWGSVVFSTTDPDDCWDGNYNGRPADEGNYVYYLKAQTTCGPVKRKGNLLLVR